MVTVDEPDAEGGEPYWSAEWFPSRSWCRLR